MQSMKTLRSGKRFLLLLSMLGLMLAGLAVAPVDAAPISGDDGPQVPEEDPDTLFPPLPPFISAKTTSALTVKWNGAAKAGQSYRILRVSPGATTVLISGTAASTVTVEDTGLNRDTVYCYVAEVDDPDFGTLPSSNGCGYTLAGQSVLRLQLTLETADLTDANTDSSVYVIIGNRTTWLDHSRDDFERGDLRTYDLTPVGDTADIRSLRLGKTGSDGWCVKRLVLLVNGGSMFSKSFTNTPSGCLWLDNEGGASLSHFISGAGLRAHPDWATYQAPFPEVTGTTSGVTGSFEITATELRDRIEGMVGNAIHGTPLFWDEGRQGVFVNPHPTLDNAVRVAVRVKGEGGYFSKDAHISIDFDLVFALDQDAFGAPINISITDDNLFVESVGSFDDDGAEDQVRDEWPGVDLGFQIDVDAILEPLVTGLPDLAAYVGRCCDTFAVEVDTQGNVQLIATLSPTPPPPPYATLPGNGGLPVLQQP
jgi:hypothetical protein